MYSEAIPFNPTSKRIISSNVTRTWYLDSNHNNNKMACQNLGEHYTPPDHCVSASPYQSFLEIFFDRIRQAWGVCQAVC